jgi:hypothetical protein
LTYKQDKEDLIAETHPAAVHCCEKFDSERDFWGCTARFMAEIFMGGVWVVYI